MNVQICRTCGNKFDFCGCPGKSMECNVCNPSQAAGPRVEKNDFNLAGFIAPFNQAKIPMPEYRHVDGQPCNRTIEQIRYWKTKIIDLKVSGHIYTMNLTMPDVNRMIGNLDSALNTNNYCFRGVEEAEAAVTLALAYGY